VKPIFLLDDSISIEIFFSSEDRDLEDNICAVITECCPEEEKIFKHEESHIFLPRLQARELAAALSTAVQESEKQSL
jgi:hypothetical protein